MGVARRPGAANGMNMAIEADGVCKSYRIRHTEAVGPTRRRKLAQLLLGQSFEGSVTVTARRVVDDVSLTIDEGEAVALLGPNGAGKSTLLEMIATGLSPDVGTIRVMGHDTVIERERAKRFITPVFPMFGANDMWTGRQNLEYSALLYNVSSREMTRRMRHVLEVTDLGARADDMVMKYSTGMRVKLALGMGLMIDQPVYLMDEPFLGVDPSSARAIRSFLKEAIAARGHTLILATHLLDDAEELCHRAAFMSEGKLAAIGTPQALKRSMHGLETVDIEVAGLNGRAEMLLRDLAGIEGAIEPTLLPGENGSAEYRMRARDSRTLLPAVIAAIHNLGCRVRHVRVQEPTLEDAFIHYTGTQLSED